MWRPFIVGDNFSSRGFKYPIPSSAVRWFGSTFFIADQQTAGEPAIPKLVLVVHSTCRSTATSPS